MRGVSMNVNDLMIQLFEKIDDIVEVIADIATKGGLIGLKRSARRK
jgi:hypothetical protein